MVAAAGPAIATATAAVGRAAVMLCRCNDGLSFPTTSRRGTRPLCQHLTVGADLTPSYCALRERVDAFAAFAAFAALAALPLGRLAGYCAIALSR